MKKIAKCKRLIRVSWLIILTLAINLIATVVRVRRSTFTQHVFRVCFWSIDIKLSWDNLTVAFASCIVIVLLLIIWCTVSDYLERLEQDLPSVLEQPVDANHGDTLDEVMWGIHDERVEYAAYFTQDGEKVAEQTTLNPTGVNVQLVMSLRGMVGIHNHPSLRSVSALSDNDMLHMAWNELHSFSAIGRYHLYVMTNRNYVGSRANYGALKSYIDELQKQGEGSWLSSSYVQLVFSLTGLWPLYVLGWSIYRLYVNWKVAQKFGYEFRVKSLRLLRLKKKLRSGKSIAKFGMAVTAAILTLVLPAEFAYNANLSYEYAATVVTPTAINRCQVEKTFSKNLEKDSSPELIEENYSELAKASAENVATEFEKENNPKSEITPKAGCNSDDSTNWVAVVGGGENLPEDGTGKPQDLDAIEMVLN